MPNWSAPPACIVALVLSVIGASGQVSAPIELIPAGSTWSYLDNNIDPNAPPNLAFDWTLPEFDDSAWPIGDRDTILRQGVPPSTSYYFRHSFEVSEAQIESLEEHGFYQLVFQLLRDDGAIVYVNGVELIRSNVSATESGLHETRAEASGGGGEQAWNTFVRNADGVLKPGTNVVAVSVHKSAPESPKLSFNLSMDALKFQSFGYYRPPAGIQFDEPDPTAGNTVLGWVAFPTGGAEPAGWGVANQSDRFSNTPPEGFASGHLFFNRGGRTTLTTLANQAPGGGGADPLRYRVDLRNYRDVEVSFGLRVDDTDAPFPGFELSDSIRFAHLLSENGIDFVREEVLNLRGGGDGGVSAERVPLVEESDLKAGLVPTAEDHAAIGSTWREPGFDDSAWQQFQLGVGFDSSPLFVPFIGWNTQAEMKGVNASCYLRVPFEVDDRSAFSGLTLYLRDDDGYVVFINGDEVARNSAPSELTWNSSATASRNDTLAVPLTPVDISEHLDKLQNGSNILAIHCLNVTAGSSDFLVSAELTAVMPNLIPDNDPPQSLNDINYGIDGPFYQFTFPVDDTVNSYGFEILFASSEDEETMFFDNFEITGTPIEVDGYHSWIQLQTGLGDGESAGRFADPDRDGIINLLEFAFGSDPELNARTSVSGGPILPVVELIEEPNGTFYDISWRQRDSVTSGSLEFPFGGYTVQGIRYLPQFSTDGEHWEDGRVTHLGEEVGEPIDNGDGTLTYRMRYRSEVLGDGGLETLFGRLAIIPESPIVDDGF